MRTLLSIVLLLLILVSGGFLLFYLGSGGGKPTGGVLFWGAVIVVLFGQYQYLTRGKKPKREPVARTAPKLAVFQPPLHPLVVPAPTRRSAAADAKAAVPLPIRAVRDLMGDVPRVFAPELAEYLRAEPPAWLVKRSDDELARAFARQEEIRCKGPVVWAAIAQANKLLFKPGVGDSPASVVYSLDPWFDANPPELLAIGRELYNLKGTEQADPEAATFARVLTNELTRAMRLKVPARFSGGRKVFHSSIMVSRKHLPKGYVTGNVFPVWVDPIDNGSLLLVPAAYWPPRLLTYWDPTPLPAENAGGAESMV